jgi:hypothetical protein
MPHVSLIVIKITLEIVRLLVEALCRNPGYVDNPKYNHPSALAATPEGVKLLHLHLSRYSGRITIFAFARHTGDSWKKSRGFDLKNGLDQWCKEIFEFYCAYDDSNDIQSASVRAFEPAMTFHTLWNSEVPIVHRRHIRQPIPKRFPTPYRETHRRNGHR